jgi:hypothetical protein
LGRTRAATAATRSHFGSFRPVFMRRRRGSWGFAPACRCNLPVSGGRFCDSRAPGPSRSSLPIGLHVLRPLCCLAAASPDGAREGRRHSRSLRPRLKAARSREKGPTRRSGAGASKPSRV